MACMNAIRKARHDADLGLVVPEHLSIRLTRREGDAELSVNRADTHLEQVRTRLTLSIEDAVGAIDGAAGKGPLGIWKDDPKAAAQRALDLLSDVRDIATESFAGLSESFNSIRKAHQLHADAAMEVVDDAQAQFGPRVQAAEARSAAMMQKEILRVKREADDLLQDKLRAMMKDDRDRSAEVAMEDLREQLEAREGELAAARLELERLREETDEDLKAARKEASKAEMFSRSLMDVTQKRAVEYGKKLKDIENIDILVNTRVMNEVNAVLEMRVKEAMDNEREQLERNVAARIQMTIRSVKQEGLKEVAAVTEKLEASRREVARLRAREKASGTQLRVLWQVCEAQLGDKARVITEMARKGASVEVGKSGLPKEIEGGPWEPLALCAILRDEILRHQSMSLGRGVSNREIGGPLKSASPGGVRLSPPPALEDTLPPSGWSPLPSPGVSRDAEVAPWGGADGAGRAGIAAVTIGAGAGLLRPGASLGDNSPGAAGGAMAGHRPHTSEVASRPGGDPARSVTPEGYLAVSKLDARPHTSEAAARPDIVGGAMGSGAAAARAEQIRTPSSQPPPAAARYNYSGTGFSGNGLRGSRGRDDLSRSRSPGARAQSAPVMEDSLLNGAGPSRDAYWDLQEGRSPSPPRGAAGRAGARPWEEREARRPPGGTSTGFAREQALRAGGRGPGAGGGAQAGAVAAVAAAAGGAGLPGRPECSEPSRLGVFGGGEGKGNPPERGRSTTRSPPGRSATRSPARRGHARPPRGGGWSGSPPRGARGRSVTPGPGMVERGHKGQFRGGLEAPRAALSRRAATPPAIAGGGGGGGDPSRATRTPDLRYSYSLSSSAPEWSRREGAGGGSPPEAIRSWEQGPSAGGASRPRAKKSRADGGSSAHGRMRRKSVEEAQRRVRALEAGYTQGSNLALGVSGRSSPPPRGRSPSRGLGHGRSPDQGWVVSSSPLGGFPPEVGSERRPASQGVERIESPARGVRSAPVPNAAGEGKGLRVRGGRFEGASP